jgi:hypothetical protein
MTEKDDPCFTNFSGLLPITRDTSAPDLVQSNVSLVIFKTISMPFGTLLRTQGDVIAFSLPDGKELAKRSGCSKKICADSDSSLLILIER